MYTRFFHIGRGVDGFVPQGPHLVDTVVGGSVQLQYIQKTAVFDAHAGGALAAGIAVHRVLAVDGLGQDFGTGGLAGAPGACEEVRMGGAALRHLLTRVWVMWDWPMTSENVLGRHLRYRA